MFFCENRAIQSLTPGLSDVSITDIIYANHKAYSVQIRTIAIALGVDVIPSDFFSLE